MRPQSVGPHPQNIGRRCRTRTDIQSLEGSVLILLNEAPSYVNRVSQCERLDSASDWRGRSSVALRSPRIDSAGCRNRTCFVSLKRRVHSRICQSRKLWWVTLCPNARKPRASGARWNRTSLVSLKRRVHQPSLPVTHNLWKARWELNPHELDS